MSYCIIYGIYSQQFYTILYNIFMAVLISSFSNELLFYVENKQTVLS